MDGEGTAAPRRLLLRKTMVRGYVNSKGEYVEPHEDGRPVGERRRRGGAPEGEYQGIQHKRAAAEEAPRERPAAPKRYGPAALKVGQEVTLRGKRWEVVSIAGGVAKLRGPDGEAAAIRLPSAPMRKAEAAAAAPLLLLKGGAPGRQGPQGAKGAPGGKAEAEKRKGKPSGSGVAAGGAPKETAPPRGAPDGEHEMEHHERVAFQHGKVKGEGEIVASGADGVTVRDDAGREHPVRHDNLLGPAGEEETPDPLDDGAEGSDPAAAKGSESKGEGSERDAGEGDPLKDIDPSKLKKILAALRALAPLFGGKVGRS